MKTIVKIDLDKILQQTEPVVLELGSGEKKWPGRICIDRFDFLMQEIWRVLKPTGRKFLYVPHFSNPYYYSDYTHKRFFGLYTFEYFSHRQTRFKRKVPSFYQEYGFVTEEMTLVFTSPWKGRKLFKRLFQALVNLHPCLMEFYEENLCYLIPCYALRATLKPVKDSSPAQGEKKL